VWWNEIPTGIQEAFRPYGPARVSRARFDGTLSNTLYVWQGDGLEIGFYNTVADVHAIFAPAHRKWHKSHLDAHEFQDIPPTNEVS
jgi:hypothetical protein